jgi:hypothetical protein
VKPAQRAQLRYQLHQLDLKTLAELEAQIRHPKPLTPWRSPLVRFTTVMLIAVSTLGLVFINVNGVIENLFVMWGAYVLALDSLIIYRTIRRIAGRSGHPA